MKLLEAIARADELRPNAISNSMKASWVYQLEGELAEMIKIPYPINPFPEDAVLVMPYPKDNIYELYLCAMIDNAQEDTELYMNDMSVANAAIDDAKKWYMRNYHRVCNNHFTFNGTANVNISDRPEYFIPKNGMAIDKDMLLEAISEYFEKNPVANGRNGIDGVDGKDGADGYTPVKGVDYSDGVDGKDGKDGITPRIAISSTNNGVLIQSFVGDIEDSRATLTNGVNGTNGTNGRDGADGYTPVKGVDYFDGENGADGKDGNDGYTPQKNVDYFDGKDGKDGKDGAKGDTGNDGYTPVRGTDYWTSEDKQEIINTILDELTDAESVSL